MNIDHRYHIDFTNAYRHLAQISLWIPTRDAQTVQIAFPVWTPGSYMVREYTRNIEFIRGHATARQCGEPTQTIELKRVGKNRWEADCQPDSSWLCIEYQLYCRENSVRTNWIERDYGFITGAATFPFVVGRELEPIELHLTVPSVWTDQATSLKRIPQKDRSIVYRAENFHDLVDSPIVCGGFETQEFEVGGAKHYFANVGGDALWDLDRAVKDMSIIVAEHQAFWQDVPYKEYWFLNLCTEAGGGLEHDNSTVLMSSRWAMRRRESYINWLALVSHEFFHTWNVRRLRPRGLMQYDYEQEQFIEELWIAEGITSYFDDLALARTGICTRDEFLGRMTANVQAVQNAPGRLVQDLRNASWDTWTKHYRPDENSQNARISYYLKGCVVAWLLDAQLRRATDGKVNLDHITQELWKRFCKTGYILNDFCGLVEEFSCNSVRQWLELQVGTAEELDLSIALKWFGLRFAEIGSPNSIEKSVAKVWIGSESTPTEGKLFVRRVFRNSPSDRAGLNVDDELISFDGYRVTPETWPTRLEVYEPDQELELLVSRRGKILSLRITLGHKPKHNWQLEVDPDATAEAKSQLNQWLQSSHSQQLA